MTKKKEKKLTLVTKLEVIKTDNAEASLEIKDEVCPECGSELFQRVGHCATCLVCGYSLCSL
jgi:hypothetical protein